MFYYISIINRPRIVKVTRKNCTFNVRVQDNKVSKIKISNFYVLNLMLVVFIINF